MSALTNQSAGFLNGPKNKVKAETTREKPGSIFKTNLPFFFPMINRNNTGKYTVEGRKSGRPGYYSIVAIITYQFFSKF